MPIRSLPNEAFYHSFKEAAISLQDAIMTNLRKFVCVPFELVFFSALLATSNTVFAQSHIAVGEYSGEKHFVLSPAEVQRVGKGVMLSVARDKDNGATGETFYFSCDAKFISAGIGFALAVDATPAARLSSIHRELQNAREEFLSYATPLEDFSESTLDSKERIKRLLPEICKSAKPERRGALIPFFKSSPDKDGTSIIVSLMTGYGNRRGDIVESWTTSHYVTRREMRHPVTGEVWKNKNGDPIYESPRNKDKGTVREKWSVKCKSQEVAVVSTSAYDQNGTLDRARSYDSAQPRYEVAVPRTLGESVLDTLCAIY